MFVLLAGLALFFLTHGIRIYADGWRTATIARMGQNPWKGLYSLLSLAGVVLIVVGYGEARAHPVMLWLPPAWTRHVTALLMLVAFILFASVEGPPNPIKARLGHPMVLGVKTWALAHLLANGLLAQVLLFGTFLLWAVLDYAAARRRDRRDGVVRGPGGRRAWILPVVAGVAVWWLFARYAHLWLIGVSPMG